jgi:dolichyldiphosphatase
MEAELKHFGLTHIVHPRGTTGILLALLSLSPIFLFVSYFTLLIFGRRLSLLLLAAGSVGNEALSLLLKRLIRAPRPFPHIPHVGDGYGMPSSHAQAGAFVFAWGLGYACSLEARYGAGAGRQGARGVVRRVRAGIYLFGLLAWSGAVAYSRYVGPLCAGRC